MCIFYGMYSMYNCPSASEVTLKDMGQWTTPIYKQLMREPQGNQAKPNNVDI